MRTIPLLTDRYRVFALIRNPVYLEKLRALGAVPVIGDLDNRASLTRITGLANAILHFAPPSSAPSLAERVAIRPGYQKTVAKALVMTRGFERDIRARNLLSALSRGALPERLVYISTSSVYGDCGGAFVSESHPLNPQTARTQRRVDAERQIRSWASRNRVKASILRVPGIYAADRLPLERLRTGAPAILQQEDSYVNHIHADDLARISIAALRHGNACRVYHASDDSELKMGDYFDLVADAFGLPHTPRLTRTEIKHIASPMLWSFMNESRRLTNQRMKQELKVRLHYPTVADMLADFKP